MRQITLYVPENDNYGRMRPGVLEWVARKVIGLAGGATITRGQGLWIGSRLFREPVAMVSALVPADADIGPYRKLAGFVKERLAQESVLLTVTDRIQGEFI
ncbi:MAG: hypothetical protein V3T08_09875 [Gemmatimonadota bacterium]